LLLRLRVPDHQAEFSWLYFSGSVRLVVGLVKIHIAGTTVGELKAATIVSGTEQ
jgi:hypothetical protein